jgi:hypothetical protein
MTLKASRFFSFLIGGLILTACASNGGTSMAPITPAIRPEVANRQAHATPGHFRNLHLYVTSTAPYFFSGYNLPLHNGALPRFNETGVNEPVPVTGDLRDLYVGSFDEGTIYVYPLPLAIATSETLRSGAIPHESNLPLSGSRSLYAARRPATNGGIPSGLGDLSGLAVAGGRLYAAGAGRADHEVLEYKLPLVAGEAPSARLVGFPNLDFLSLAAKNGTLYVASTTNGTVAAYRLPLRNAEAPEYTISTAPQIDGATGVAVNAECSYLYVSLFALGDVYQYSLPYHAGEAPTVLNVRLASQGGLPYGIAVARSHLFVTARSILAFRIPFASNATPEASISFAGSAAGVAAGN